jgi:hypothetical protein
MKPFGDLFKEWQLCHESFIVGLKGVVYSVNGNELLPLQVRHEVLSLLARVHKHAFREINNFWMGV